MQGWYQKNIWLSLPLVLGTVKYPECCCPCGWSDRDLASVSSPLSISGERSRGLLGSGGDEEVRGGAAGPVARVLSKFEARKSRKIRQAAAALLPKYKCFEAAALVSFFLVSPVSIWCDEESRCVLLRMVVWIIFEWVGISAC